MTIFGPRLLWVLLACGPVERYACPEVDYVPVGPVIVDRCECVDGVAFLCEDVCASPSLTCEPVDHVNAYLAGPCATCQVDIDSELRLTCGHQRY